MSNNYLAASVSDLAVCNPVDLSEETDMDSLPEKMVSLAPKPAVFSPEEENILIVDDQHTITDLIKELLRQDGNVDVAHNGQDALELIDNKFYKLIISDIKMPKMDGFSFFKEAVAKFPKLKNRFLFITGNLSSGRRDFFDKNRVKYIKKPMKMNMLREEAKRIIVS